MKKATLVLVTVIIALACSTRAGLQDPFWTRHRVFEYKYLKNCDQSFDVATDADGNVIVVGYVAEPNIGNGDWEASILLVKYNANGDALWVRTPGAITNGCDEATAVATDAMGNIYITGNFYGAATFDTAVVTSAGNSDIFVAKYDPGGTIVWVRRAGGSTDDHGRDVTVDASGACFVTGQFSGIADFDGTILSSSSQSDVFLAKYDSAGNLAWVLGGSSSLFGIGFTVAADDDGNCFLSGSGDDVVLGDSLLSASGLFVTKVSGDGQVTWHVEGAGGYGPMEIATDSDGACYLTGLHRGLVFPDTSFVQNTLYFEGYVVKYSSAGSFEWGREFSATDFISEAQGHRIVVSPSGECLVSGHFFGVVDISGDTTLVNNGPAPPDPREAFVVVYDSDGNFQCVEQYGNGQYHGLPIATDDFGNVFTLSINDSVIDVDSLAYFLGKHGDTPTGVDDDATPRFDASLLESYPNPFNPATTIRYHVSESSRVRLLVFDVSGRRVRTLVDGPKPVGTYEVTWDGTNESNQVMASGVYFVRYKAGSEVATRKTVLLK